MEWVIYERGEEVKPCGGSTYVFIYESNGLVY